MAIAGSANFSLILPAIFTGFLHLSLAQFMGLLSFQHALEVIFILQKLVIKMSFDVNSDDVKNGTDKDCGPSRAVWSRLGVDGLYSHGIFNIIKFFETCLQDAHFFNFWLNI